MTTKKDDLKELLLQSPDRELDARVKPYVEKWDDPPTTLQILEVLDLCVNGSLASGFMIKFFEVVLDEAIQREATTYDDVVKQAIWRDQRPAAPVATGFPVLSSREKLLAVLPHLRLAMKEAQVEAGADGFVGLGVIAVAKNLGGQGRITARFEAREFVDDLAVALGEDPSTIEEGLENARGEKLMQQLGLRR